MTAFCSGNGQYHSINSKKDPKPYLAVTFDQIRAMLGSPAEVEKPDAPWAIFSTLHTREAKTLRESGEYGAVWADVDEPDGLTFREIVSRACGAVPGRLDCYASRSATDAKQKSRILCELSELFTYDEWSLVQKVFNDKLQAAGINVDRVTEVANQLCYLPNRGAFYDYQEGQGEPLDVALWYEEINAEAVARARADEAARQARPERKPVDPAKVPEGGVIPSEYIRSNYSARQLLEAEGALFVSDTRFYAPGRKRDGNAGGIYDPDNDRFFVHHENDPFHDGYWHGAIDLLMKQHGLDWRSSSAFVELCRCLEVSPGVTIEKHNQRAYAAEQERKQVFDDFADETDGESDEQENIFDLTRFSLRGKAAEMEAKMLDDRFILGRMAILGQSTVFYAKPNAGKTLLTLWLVMQAIKSGEIDGEDVFYINADDNHKGITYKLKLAERVGFHMLAPGYQGFKAQHLGAYLTGLVMSETARGKILILDTVKKFTDIMDKKRGSDFGESVRQFVAHGGSVIMLAHVNKHRDEEGKVVYSGTSDLVDDADCAYTLDTVTEDSGGTRTVKFENFKSRGDVASEEVYKYDAADGTPYNDRLDSVTRVSDEEREAAENRRKALARLERNADAVDVIKECIREGIGKKTELVAAACERSGISKVKMLRALKEHTGKSVPDYQFWQVDIEDKNAHVYRLNLFA